MALWILPQLCPREPGLYPLSWTESCPQISTLKPQYLSLYYKPLQGGALIPRDGDLVGDTPSPGSTHNKGHERTQ